MKEDEEKNIDRKFREGLANPEDHIAYNDADWDAMEALLNERKKRGGLIFRLPFMLGAAAAMLLLALGLYFFWPDGETNNNLTGIKRRPATDTVTSVKTQDGLQQREEIAKKESSDSSPEINGANDTIIANRRRELKVSETNKNGTMMLATVTPKKGQRAANKLKFPNNRGNEGIVRNDVNTLAIVPPGIETGVNSVCIEVDSGLVNKVSQQAFASLTAAQHITLQKADTPAQAFTVPIVKEKKKRSVEITGAKHPVILSVVAAPDFNGVGSAFNRTQIGSNAGLLLSVGITRKLTITIGAVYSKKPYLVGMDKYNTNYKFRVQPDDVSADCRVLDIPLNIDYQVYNQGRNMFSVGTGLSSYFMLRENYHFNHSGYYVGPSDYNIKNQNKHILGVVNLNATYQRRINSKFGLNVQPYMKLPITDIGYGRVNLKSTGVAIGASWYLNTSAAKK